MNRFRSLKKILLGKELSNSQLTHEKLSRFWGLPIMASDAVSSVAYAVEEILMALVPALGIAAVSYVGLVSIPIIVLLVILVFSYTQIINHYPNGGGAYIVSKENFGRRPSLLAATCLIVDYIMTVAVSISSSTAAIVAAFPGLHEYRVPISLVCLALITLVNLRGVGESAKIFGIPTYAFILSMGVLIVTGLVRMFSGTLVHVSYSAAQQALLPPETLQGITLILFLRAFSSGCSALTGVEAVSNAIPSFKEPSQRTARHVLFMLGAIIVFIFGGTSFLASFLKVVPLPGTTVMSQMAQAVFGNGFMYFVLQFTTSLILLLAANTAYNGLPILLSILAKDRYVPHQFSQRGTKLSFSNGIIAIFIVGGILMVIFNADTHRLIPFYAVGVFVSFTISQAGMFMKWLKDKDPGWHVKSLINGFGAVITFVGTIVVFVTKFSHGAWFLLIIVPLMMMFMAYTHKHYTIFYRDISSDGYDYHFTESRSNDKLPCVMLMHYMNKAALKTFDYAKDISSNLTVLHISTNPAHTQKLQQQWAALGITIPLTVIDAPYRDIITPMNDYISQMEATLNKHEMITVVLTKFVGSGWRDAMFHNQTAFFLERTLGRHRNVATVLVPYLYHQTKGGNPS